MLTEAAVLVSVLLGVQGARVTEPALTLRNDVVFFEDFEDRNWRSHWSTAGGAENTELVSGPDACFGQGASLKVKVRAGDHYGISLIFRTSRMPGGEPDELYMRYYLKFDPDWICRGGKMPGFGGTYGRAGWGGRPVNGSDGWSARGIFADVRGDTVPIGWYCYHADMTGRYGSEWLWRINNRGYLKKGLWYCIESHVKLNTPGKNDGVLRGWVNGLPAYEKTDVRFRDVPTLKVETVWFNVYNGGTWTADTDCHLYLDNIVVAANYIGPFVTPEQLRSALRPQKPEKQPLPPPPEDPDKAVIDALSKVRSLLPSDPAAALAFLDALKTADASDAAAFEMLRRGVSARSRLHDAVRAMVRSGARTTVYADFAGVAVRARIEGVDGNDITASTAGGVIPVSLDAMPPRRLFALLADLTADAAPVDVYIDAAAFGTAWGVEAGRLNELVGRIPDAGDASERKHVLRRLAGLLER